MLAIALLRICGVVLFILALALVGVGWVARGPLVLRASSSTSTGRPSSSTWPSISVQNLRATVKTLCVDLAPRSYHPPSNLARVADWIAGRLRETGLVVMEQDYRTSEGTYRNVIALRQGTDRQRGVTVIGAHYDTCGPFPGADDNASGVAVLLELVRTLPKPPPRSSQFFVAFGTEEDPFFGSQDMGSAHFARKLSDDGTRVELMIALDLVGFFSDEPGSQSFPYGFLQLYYPGRGNFIAVVGDLGAGRWIRRVKRGMLAAKALPVYSFRGPSLIPGIDWSDHFSFRQLGLPGVLVTDTAFLRNAHYHQPTDTPGTLDYSRMAAVVQALHGVLAEEGT